jgi:hypothetical protein
MRVVVMVMVRRRCGCGRVVVAEVDVDVVVVVVVVVVGIEVEVDQVVARKVGFSVRRIHGVVFVAARAVGGVCRSGSRRR